MQNIMNLASLVHDIPQKCRSTPPFGLNEEAITANESMVSLETLVTILSLLVCGAGPGRGSNF